MLLTYEDKNQIISRFPQIKLSYEKILHTKVYSNIFMIIPKGIKMFAWFTFWKGQNVCFFIKLNEKGCIIVSDINIYPVNFSNEIALGTIFYGTYFDIKGQNFFSCENIFYYKGRCIEHYNFKDKLHKIGSLFTNNEIIQKSFTKYCVVFGLPIIKSNYTQAYETVKLMTYNIYGIQVYNIDKNDNVDNSQPLGIFLTKNQQINLEGIFRVKAAPNCDIYNLFCYDPKNINQPYSIALIPTYKSSVLMNSLFRSIKENSNLDLLEESDDEDEFQNISENKFVNLEKSYIMKCIYNIKIKKWEPHTVIKENNTKLITFKEAKLIEN
jgi:hypothetical protein